VFATEAATSPEGIGRLLRQLALDALQRLAHA
jgi:hypothetical protein